MDDLREMVLKKVQTSKDRRTVSDVLGAIKTPGDDLAKVTLSKDAVVNTAEHEYMAIREVKPEEFKIEYL
jgi:hypothetical protein